MIGNQVASATNQSVSPAQSPLEGALETLHAELSYLENTVASLGQRVTRLLEPSPGSGAQGQTALPPAPNTVKATVDSATSRTAEVRSFVQDLLDRLHV